MACRHHSSPLLLIFSIGFQSVIAQTLLLREYLVVFFGNELCIGVVLGFWLLGIATGAVFGGRLFRKGESGIGTAAALIAAQAVLLITGLSCTRLLFLVLRVPAGAYLSIGTLSLSTLWTVVPFSFLIGMLFPLACKVCFRQAGTHAADCSTEISAVYIWEALGALGGGVLLTFVLLPRLPALTIAIGTDALVLASAAYVITREQLRVPVFAAVFVLALFHVGLLVTGAAGTLEDLTVRARFHRINPDATFVQWADSRYQHMDLARLGDQYTLYCNGQFTSAFPDPYGDEVKAHFYVSMIPEVKKARVILLGGGVEGLAAPILTYPVDELKVVQLDRREFELLRPFVEKTPQGRLWMKASREGRTSLVFGDPRFFVKTEGKRYDLAVLNFPEPSTAMLNRFYTQEFFRETRSLLKPDGVLVLSVGGEPNYLGERTGRYAASIYQTLKSVFPNVLVAPGETLTLFASRDPRLTFSIPVLSRRFEERGVPSPYFTKYHFSFLLPPGLIESTRTSLERSAWKQLNTDKKPVTYFLNILLWLAYAGGSRGRPLFARLVEVRPYWFLVPVVIALFMRLVYLRFRGIGPAQVRVHVLTAIGVAGFTGMALEIVLLFSFQNVFGYLFYKVGFIVSLFMMGLALGGAWANRTLRRERDHYRLFAACTLGIALFSILLPLWIRIAENVASAGATRGAAGLFLIEIPFYLAVTVSGFLTGCVFPLAGKLCISMGTEGPAAAALVDSADNLGAAAGAMLTGVFLLPVLGLDTTCIALFALGLSAFVLLLFRARPA
jgi:predicted membrane-bound spermidine synthase